uniref:Uncharacterized protein n=1 Tax=Glossina pallidipes TaxID=7398 RepID=A0A1A9Z502_GLOPL
MKDFEMGLAPQLPPVVPGNYSHTATAAGNMETLRKWTPAVLMDRVCNQDITYELKDGKKLEIKKDDVIWMLTAGVHRDSAYYENPYIKKTYSLRSTCLMVYKSPLAIVITTFSCDIIYFVNFHQQHLLQEEILFI